MADFEKLVSKRVLDVKPGKDDVYDITLSEDYFGFFITGGSFDQPFRITVLDQGRLSSDKDTKRDEIRRRSALIKALNKEKLVASTFVLSSDTMPYYNELMAKARWKNKEKTGLYMPIDYEPLKVKDFKIEFCQGTLMVPEKTLIWMQNLDRAGGKVNSQVLADAEFFRRFIPQFMQRLYDKYDLSNMDEFCRTQIISDFVDKSIKYADWAVEEVDGKMVLKKDAPTFLARPAEVLRGKEGVCSGISRVKEILLNNPYMMVNANCIYGSLNSSPHTWLGVEINDKCYQVDSKVGAFRDLDHMGYVPRKGQVITDAYNHAFLQHPEAVEEKVKQYTKK